MPRRFLRIEFGGRGMPPPLRTNSIAPTAPHPAPSGPPSPRGRRIPDRSAAFCKVHPYTTSEPRKRGPPPPTRREANSEVPGQLLRVKPSPAYRGWPRRGRVWRGAGTIFGLPGKTIGPTSVSPKGLPPSPQGEGFPQKLLTPYFYLRTLPRSAHRADSPLLEGAKGLYLVSVPTAPHPSALKGSHLPLHAGRLTPRRFCVWHPSGRGMPPPLQRHAGRFWGIW